MSKTQTPAQREAEAKKAFVRSGAGYEFDGKKLQTFTAQRQAAAAFMGLRFGLVDDTDIFSISVEALKGKKRERRDLQFYNQMFADVITVIWLCSVPESRALRALRKTDEAKTESFKWADHAGISLTSSAYYEAAAVFFQIMQDITISTGIPKSNGSTTEEEEDDDPNE